MTPDVAIPELMGAREACVLLGVRSSNLRALAGLPEPVQTLASGPVWLADDLRAFADQRRARQTQED
jgi:hypothetical protein